MATTPDDELTPRERAALEELEAEQASKVGRSQREADRAAAAQLQTEREALAAELLQQRAAAGEDVGDPEVLAQVEREAWDEVNRRRYGEKPKQRKMAAHTWYWARLEDRPLPPPVWPEPHPLAPDPPLRLASGWDPEAWYRASCRRRGWVGRRPRPGEGLPQCSRCGLRFKPEHQRPEDRGGSACFRCLARQRGWMPPLEPGRVPARLDAQGLRVYGLSGAQQDTTRQKLPALAAEVVRALGGCRTCR